MSVRCLLKWLAQLDTFILFSPYHLCLMHTHSHINELQKALMEYWGGGVSSKWTPLHLNYSKAIEAALFIS